MYARRVNKKRKARALRAIAIGVALVMTVCILIPQIGFASEEPIADVEQEQAEALLMEDVLPSAPDEPTAGNEDVVIEEAPAEQTEAEPEQPAPVPTDLPAAELTGTTPDISGNSSNGEYFSLNRLTYIEMNQTTKAVNLKLDVALDQNILNDYLAKKEDLLKQDAFATNEEYYKYLDELSDEMLEPITFNYVFDETTLKYIAPPPGNIITEKLGKVGSFNWDSTAQTGKLIFSGTFDKRVYALLGVAFGMDLSVVAKDISNIGSGEAELLYNAEGMISFDFPAKGVEDNDPSTNYDVDKAAVNAVSGDASDAFVEYKITVTAKNTGKLNGKKFVDELPAGLYYSQAKLYLGEAAEYEDILSAVADPELRKLEYTFADSGEDIKKAVFTLQADLSVAEMQSFMTKRGGGFADYSKKFDNKAILHRSEKDGGQEVSYGANETTIKLPKFFDKSGSPSATDNRVYEWEINANTRGTADKCFIVDSLDPSVHKYDVTNSSITINGQPYSINDNAGTAPFSYEDLTNTMLEGGSFPAVSGNAELYHSSGQDILIIPVKNNGTDLLGKQLTIKYSTIVQGTAQNVPANITNRVKLLWSKFEYGPGTGAWAGFGFDFDIGKNYEPNGNVVTKSNAGYRNEPGGPFASWKFVVNAYSNSLDEVTVTDALKNSEQEFLLNDGRSEPLVLSNSGGEDISVPYGTTGEYYYNFAEAGTGADKVTTFMLHIGKNMSAKNRYTFTLDTRVKDTGLLAQNTSSKDVKNSAGYKAKLSGDGGSFEKIIEASSKQKNTLLEKSAGYKYDFSTQSVGWKMTVNTSKVPIDDATIKDELPLGTVLGESVRVSRDGGTPVTLSLTQLNAGYMLDGTVIKLTSQPGTQDGYQKDAFTISFGGQIRNTYTFEYDSVFTEKYRRERFVDNAKIDIPNACMYVAPSKVYDVGVVAAADSKHDIAQPPLKKTGQYVVVNKNNQDHVKKYGADRHGAGLVDWSILVNRHSVDMGGAKVVDSLAAKPYFEIDTDSFKIYAPALDANTGEVSAKNAELGLLADMNLSLSSSGFEFTIPSAYKNTPLLVEFTSYIVDNVQAADLKNSAQTRMGDGDSLNTGDVSAKDAKAFNHDQYANASEAPLLSIVKSSNTASDGGEDCINLAGAEFTLTEMEQQSGNFVEKPDRKVKTTLAGGKGTFYFLRKDRLYKLEETKAPDGYVKDAQLRYCWFKGNLPAPASVNGVAVTEYTSSRAAIAIKNEPVKEPGATVPGARLSMLKTSQDGLPMKNVKFELKYTAASGKSITKNGTSAENGTFTIEGIDPGIEYTLTENTPQGCLPAGPWKVKAAYSAVSGYSFSIDPALKLENGKYKLENEYTTHDLELNGVEVVDGDDKPVGGAKFVIYTNDGKKVGYMVWDNNSQKYLPGTAGDTVPEKNEYGSFYVQNGKLLPGEYKYICEKPPAGYLQDPAENTFNAPADSVLRFEFKKDPNYAPPEEPMPQPTEEPTAEPTEEPTAEPTEEPTAEPTEEPTAEPTETPSLEPTPSPKPSPSATATATASATPAVTPAPPSAPPEQTPGKEPIVPEGSKITQTDSKDYGGYRVDTYNSVSPSGEEMDYCVVTVQSVDGEDISGFAPPEKQGYAFAGWYLDPGHTMPYEPNGKHFPQGNSVLYIKWIKSEATPTNEAQPSPTNESTAAGGSPRTGDDSPLWLFVAIIAACGGAMAFAFRKIKS